MQHHFLYMFLLPETNPALFSFQMLPFNVLPNTHIVLSFFVSIWAPSLLSFPPTCFLFHTHTLSLFTSLFQPKYYLTSSQ